MTSDPLTKGMGKHFWICCRRGCPRRSLDSSTIYNYLVKNGLKFTNRIKNADLLTVYTCGGFQVSEDRSNTTINRLSKYKRKNAKLVVTGCLVRINPQSIHQKEADFIFPHEKLETLDSIIGAKIPFKDVPDANLVANVQDLDNSQPMSLALENFIGEFRFDRYLLEKVLGFTNRKIKNIIKKPQGVFENDTFNIKIAHGCKDKCSYCAIRLATGALKSKSTTDILEEFRSGLSKSYTRFVLSAEDTGCYGIDIGTNIVALLQQIFDEEAEFNLIINDFNIKWLIKYHDQLMPLFVKNRDKIESFRTPIQSGSDRILKLMRRPYKINNVKRVLYEMRKNLPDLDIRTHILVGFPGETESDFEASLQFLKELDFLKTSIYCYEDRPGTPAYFMADKVPTQEKKRRTFSLKKIVGR